MTYKGLLIPGHITQVVTGTDAKTGKSVQLFHGVHTTGSGKSKKSYRRTIAVVTIRKAQVHAFINSTLNDLTEQISLDTSQRYIAEGNFGKYFEMYFPDKEHTRGLSIFAPDVMQLIMADYGFNDIEVLDNVMYLYEYKLITNNKELESFYQKAQKLAAAIDDNAPRKVNLQTVQGAARAVPSLSRGSATLWQKALLLGIVTAALVQIFISPSSRARVLASLAYSVLWVVVLMGIFGAMIRSVYRRRSYKKEQHLYKK